MKKFPDAIFVGASWFSDLSSLLHNYTVLALQRKLYHQGIPFELFPSGTLIFIVENHSLKKWRVFGKFPNWHHVISFKGRKLELEDDLRDFGACLRKTYPQTPITLIEDSREGELRCCIRYMLTLPFRR
jgi:hypothetical protein